MVGLGEIKLIQQFFIFNFKLVSSGLKVPSLILLIKNSFRVSPVQLLWRLKKKESQ